MPLSQCAELASPAEALAAHDAAHGTGDTALHGLALRLMESARLEHILLDEVDATTPPDEWQGLPLIVPVQEGAVCEVGNALVVPRKVGLALQGRVVGLTLSDGDLAGTYAPIYDLCLLRRLHRRECLAPGLIPGQPLAIGPVRDSGNFRFPLIAQRCEGKLVQVHRDRGETFVADAAGERICGCGIDWAERGLWLADLTDDGLRFLDVFVHEHEQTYLLPLARRLEYMPPEDARSESVELQGLSDLHALPEGRWLVRWAQECSDIERPLWFWYDAGRVRPGQYVEPLQGRVDSVEGETVMHRLPGGLRAQVHRLGERVWLFTEGCSFDVSKRFGQITKAVCDLPTESCVLDGELVAGFPTTVLQRAVSRRKDLSGGDVCFVAFDCLYLDGQDLHESPCRERLAAFEGLRCDGDILQVAETCEDQAGPGTLCRTLDSTYPLDGTHAGWCIMEAKSEKQETLSATPLLDQEEPLAIDERAISRSWVEASGARVEQTDEPVPFAYQHSYRSLWTAEQCNEGLNQVIQGRVPAGVFSLCASLDDLRRAYRAADWSRTEAALRSGLAIPADGTQVESLVRPIAVSGSLLIAAPPAEEAVLYLSQGVVGAALQFLAVPDRIEELGSDAMLTADGGQWTARQDLAPELELLTAIGPGTVHREGEEGLIFVDGGRAILGVQKPHFHEVFLLFDGGKERSGRFAWNLITLDGRQTWLGRRPDEQVPYLYRHDQEAEMMKASEAQEWVAWNPEGIRALAKSPLKDLLPVNWESRLEPYDDAPFADFE